MAKVKYKGKNYFVTYKRIKLFSMIIPLFRYLFGQKTGVFRLVVRNTRICPKEFNSKWTKSLE